MFVRTKRYIKGIDFLETRLIRETGHLRDDILVLNSRIRGLETDLKTLMDFLKVEFISIPREYKVVSKRLPEND